MFQQKNNSGGTLSLRCPVQPSMLSIFITLLSIRNSDSKLDDTDYLPHAVTLHNISANVIFSLSSLIAFNSFSRVQKSQQW